MSAVELKADGTAENEILELTKHWVEAVERKDFDAIMTHYADDVTAFDVPAPMQIKGADAVRNNIVNWLSMFEGPAQVHFEDLKITAGEDIAFLHTLTSVTPKGEESRSWVRVTVCYQKIGGKWLVTHEHASLPVTGN